MGSSLCRTTCGRGPWYYCMLQPCSCINKLGLAVISQTALAHVCKDNNQVLGHAVGLAAEIWPMAPMQTVGEVKCGLTHP